MALENNPSMAISKNFGEINIKILTKIFNAKMIQNIRV